MFLRYGDVYIINEDGTGEAQVTDSEEFEVDPFWINTSTFFEINSGETVSETFGSEYTLCSWGAEGSAGAWAEYQCSCTESSCTCRINWYASKTKKDEPISNSTRDMSRGEVDGNVKSHNGTCQ